MNAEDRWIGGIIAALWLALIAVLVWQNWDTVLWAVVLLGPVVAFYWWGFRASQRRRRL